VDHKFVLIVKEWVVRTDVTATVTGIVAGINFGKNVVVRYSADEKKAFVDLLGPTMNMAKIRSGRSKKGSQ